VTVQRAFLPLLLGALLWAAPAAAKRVAVTDFSGPKADRTQKGIADVVSRDHTVVSSRTWNKTAKSESATGKNDADVAKVAAATGAEAVVFGKLSKSGRGYTLALEIREGKGGTVAKELTFKVRNYRLDSSEKDQIAEELLPVLAAVGDDVVVEIAPDAAPPIPVPQDTDSEAPDLSAKRPQADRPADDEDTGPAEPSRLYRNQAVDVQAGIAFIRRTLDFTFEKELTAAQKPNGYSGVLVPTVTLALEIFPLAFGDGWEKRKALSGLGITASFEKVIAIKSELGATEFPTSQTAFGFGLKYRWNFGDADKLPTLTAGAGWSHLAFTIDTDGMDIDLPNVSYSMIDMGIGARIPFGTPILAANIDARYLLVMKTGDIQDATAYGEGSRLGVDLDFGLEARLAVRNVIRAGVHYTRIAYDFDGSGSDTNRDGMPDQDVGGAVDAYLGLYATFGYLF
jgi:hypothetical protein